MNGVEVIVYGVLIIAFLALIGLAGYLAFDYLDYKKKLQDNLEKSGQGINFNFDISSSNFDTLKKTIDDNKSLLDKNITTTNSVNTYAQNTSNLISNRITNTSNLFRNRFNSFYDNMGKYFEFKDGTNNIKSTTAEPNNRIFDYIFGQNTVQNLDLIAKTTAYSGLTIMSDASKELEICNKTSPTKCIKMSTDTNGDMNIKPAGADNVVFRDKRDMIFAKFNMNNSNIFLGGSDAATSPFYIIDNNVYAKNLNMVSNNAQTHISFLPTKVTITNVKIAGTAATPATASSPATPAVPVNFTTTMKIEIEFNNIYVLNNTYKVLVDNLSLYMVANNIPIFSESAKYKVKEDDSSISNKDIDYVALYFTKPDGSQDSTLINDMTYSTFQQINVSSTINIPAGYKLTLYLKIYQKENKATQLGVVGDNETITFRTFSYLQLKQ